MKIFLSFIRSYSSGLVIKVAANWYSVCINILKISFKIKPNGLRSADLVEHSSVPLLPFPQPGTVLLKNSSSRLVYLCAVYTNISLNIRKKLGQIQINIFSIRFVRLGQFEWNNYSCIILGTFRLTRTEPTYVFRRNALYIMFNNNNNNKIDK